MPATAVRERPIPLHPHEVRAVLDGRQCQFRRAVKPQSLFYGKDAIVKRFPNQHGCPFGQPGDRLWVRETWTVLGNEDGHPIDEQGKLCQFRDAAMRYRADTKPAPYGLEELPDGSHYDGTWRPSIHMPRWASRLTLEITDVRVERLQSIGRDGRKAADVLAEGISEQSIDRERKWFHPDDAPALAFSRLWDSINAKSHPWDSNPWVWCVSFKRA